MFTNKEKKELKECTEDEQQEIFKAFLEGNVEYWEPTSIHEDGIWTKADVILNIHRVYRVSQTKEEGDTPIKGIPWEVIDRKWNWAAMDGGGDLYLFEEMPTTDTVCHCWCTSEDCRFIDDIFKIDLSDVHWHTSLTKRPENC